MYASFIGTNSYALSRIWRELISWCPKRHAVQTHIYSFTMENVLPIGVWHNSCTQLPWKPHDQGRKGTFICVVTVETSRRRQARHTHLRSYSTNLKNMCVFIYKYINIFFIFVVLPEVSVETAQCLSMFSLLQYQCLATLCVVTVDTSICSVLDMSSAIT